MLNDKVDGIRRAKEENVLPASILYRPLSEREKPAFNHPLLHVTLMTKRMRGFKVLVMVVGVIGQATLKGETTSSIKSETPSASVTAYRQKAPENDLPYTNGF
jgi:hypothetical protein